MPDNTTARAFVAHASGVLPDKLVRELWEHGGRAISGPIPVTAAEAKAMPADEAAGAAEWMTSPAECAELFRIDQRVSVRRSLATNPALGPDTAARLLSWFIERGEPLPIDLARIAGPELTAETIRNYSVSLETPRSWAELFGVERLAGLTDRSWARALLADALVAHPPALGAERIDELWDQAPESLHRAVARRLVARNANLTADWVRRLTAATVRLAADGDSLDLTRAARSTYGPIGIEHPAGLVDLVKAHANPNAAITLIRQIEHRAGEFDTTDGTATALADALIELYLATGALPEDDDARWLIARATPVKVCDFAAAHLDTPAWAQTRTGHLTASAFLARTELDDDLAARLVSAAANANLFGDWIRSSRNPTQALVAQVLSGMPAGRPRTTAAVRLLGRLTEVDDPTLAATLVADDEPLAGVIEHLEDPSPLATRLVAHLTGRPAPGPTGPVDRALRDRLADQRGPIAQSVWAQVLKKVPVDPADRLQVAAAAGCTRQFAQGLFAENPPCDESLAGADLSDPDLRELAGCKLASAATRVKVMLAANTATPSSLVDAVLATGELDDDLVDALVARHPTALGRLLAGSYEHHRPGPSHLDAADALVGHTRLEALDAFAELWAPRKDGIVTGQPLDQHPLGDAIADWVRATASVFNHLAAHRAAVVFDAVHQVIGDDAASWRLLCELSVDTDSSVNEVLSLVECAK